MSKHYPDNQLRSQRNRIPIDTVIAEILYKESGDIDQIESLILRFQ